MRKVLIPAVLLLVLASLGMAATIRGSYVEARNADVWVGHCYANSEAGLRGDLALMAWKIDEGSWNNVSLDGLGVVAVVKAKRTLGDPFSSPYPTKAALIVDERANADQRLALQSFAAKMAGDLVQSVVRVDVAPISFDFTGDLHTGTLRMTAGELARIETRPLQDADSLCHASQTYYPPLSSKLAHAMPVHTVDNRFAGEALNITWSNQDTNASFLGNFAVESE